MNFRYLDDLANAIMDGVREGTAHRVEIAAQQLSYLSAQVNYLQEIIRDYIADDWSDYDAAARYALAVESSITQPEARAVENDPAWPRLVQATAGRPYALIAARAVLRDAMPHLAVADQPAEQLARHIENTDEFRRAYLAGEITTMASEPGRDVSGPCLPGCPVCDGLSGADDTCPACYDEGTGDPNYVCTTCGWS